MTQIFRLFSFCFVGLNMFHFGPIWAADSGPNTVDEVALKEMVGQMIIVGFEGTSERDPGIKAIKQQIKSGEVGGVLLLGRNINNPNQTALLTETLRDVSSKGSFFPPFVSVDQEGGQVQRLTGQKGFDSWLSAEAVSDMQKTHGPSFAITYYGERARSLSEAGINLNFGPVLDIDVNPSNPVIGKLQRSYSQDPEVVATVGGDFVIAHRNVQIITSLKHFPGHGSSRSDSHRYLPDISTSWSEEELLPYKSLARRGLVDTVMIAHVFHPKFSDAENLPTSLSSKAVTAARALVGDATVLISDDMQMGAITNEFDERDAAVLAINAGIDVLIYSTFEKPDSQIGPRLNQMIVDAVKDGDISIERIEEAFTRIVSLKSDL